jgi:hypothetical protein
MRWQARRPQRGANDGHPATHADRHLFASGNANAERDGKMVMTAKVSGSFPGGPIDFDHIFEVQGDRIVSLEIR